MKVKGDLYKAGPFKASSHRSDEMSMHPSIGVDLNLLLISYEVTLYDDQDSFIKGSDSLSHVTLKMPNECKLGLVL